jgi:hypothetical protein
LADNSRPARILVDAQKRPLNPLSFP